MNFGLVKKCHQRVFIIDVSRVLASDYAAMNFERTIATRSCRGCMLWLLVTEFPRFTFLCEGERGGAKRTYCKLERLP